MFLTMSPDLKEYKATSTKATWDGLKAAFAKPGITQIYSDYTAAMAFKLSGRSPIPEINHLQTLFERMKQNGVKINEFIRCMMLLRTIPKEWVHLESVIIQGAKDPADFKFDNIRQAIHNEWQCQDSSKCHNPKPDLAHRLSNIKIADKKPQFVQQQQNAEAGPSSRPFGQKKRGKRAGKQAKAREESVRSKMHKIHKQISIAHPNIIELATSSEEEPLYMPPGSYAKAPVEEPRSFVE